MSAVPTFADLADRLLVHVYRRFAGKPTYTSTHSTDEENVFVLGRSLDAYQSAGEPIRLTEADLYRHLYAIGASGCGKSSLLSRLIHHWIAQGRSVCVFDFRRDLNDNNLARLAAGTIPDLESRLCLVDLTQEEWVTGIDPLRGPGNAYSRAMLVVSVIRSLSLSWGVTIEEGLRFACILLALNNRSLIEVELLFTDRRFRSQLLARCDDPVVRAYFERFDQLSSERQSAIVGPILNKLAPVLSIPLLRRMFGCRQSLDWRRMIDQPGRIILVSLAADQLHAAASLAGGLIVAGLHNAVMTRAEVPESKRVPLVLIVDEFELFGADIFCEIVAEGRRFRLGLVLAHQNLSQLNNNLRQAIRANIANQIYFQTSNCDIEELSKELLSRGSRDQLQRQMRSLQVGQAFLLRRGEPSRLVKLAYSPEPPINRDRIAQLRQAAFRHHSTPRQIVDRFIQDTYAGPVAVSPFNDQEEVYDESLPRLSGL